MALLKLDAFAAICNLVAGFAFFFQHLVGAVEVGLMIIGIVGNAFWVGASLIAVRLEYPVLTRVLIPMGLIPPSYLLYKAYDLYTVRSTGIRDYGATYTGKYHDVWIEPIMATLVFGVATRLALLVLMMQTRKNYGTGLRAFSIHREYALPERLREALTPEYAEAIRSLVRGLHLLGSLEVRESTTGFIASSFQQPPKQPPSPLVGGASSAVAPASGFSSRSRQLFNGRQRFFQLSNDLTTFRWSWREYLLLDEVVRVTANEERSDTFELHAGTVFQRRVLSLRCASAEEADLLIQSFRALLRALSLGDRAFTMYTLQLFKLADRDDLGAITAKNRRMGLGFLNIELEKEEENRALTALGLAPTAMLDFRVFLALIKRVERPPLVEALYAKHAGRGATNAIGVGMGDQLMTFVSGGLTRAAFARMWKEEQGEAPPETILQLFGQLVDGSGMLSLGAFYLLLMSSANELADPDKVGAVYQDMTHPLPHYFIHSSHRSYLASSEDLNFPSSYEMVRRCLLLGCRSLELDLWDGEGSEPMVHHEHALVGQLRFGEILRCIVDHAFVTSTYPVILSLNLHCSAPQQRTAASLLVSMLGAHLFTPPPREVAAASVPDHQSAGAEQMPSPEALQYMVLVRGVAVAGVALPEESFKSAVDVTPSSAETSQLIELELMQLLTFISRQQSSRAAQKGMSGDGVSEQSPPVGGADGGVGRAVEGLGAGRDVFHIPSLAEPQASSRLEDDPQAWLIENMSELCHVAPKVHRKGTTEPIDPTPFWDAGCQLVPLDFASATPVQQLALGKFQLNGGCGYVLKPRRLRSSSEASRQPWRAPPRKLAKMQIKVISAVHLPKPGQRRVEREGWQTEGCPLICEHELSAAQVVSPFVVVEVRGGTFAAASADLEDSLHGDVWTSRTVHRNGMSPAWIQTVEVGASDPELAVVRFSVWDRPGGDAPERFLCCATLSASAFRSGYRVLQMRDVNCCKIAFCKMLVHVRFSHTHPPRGATTLSPTPDGASNTYSA